MSERPTVSDWATDWDHLTEEWGANGPEILADLRERCPVAHTGRYHGASLVTRYDDVAEVARDHRRFSSRVTAVNDSRPEDVKLELPPLTLDPPFHGPIRRALLPAFNPAEVADLEPFVVGLADRLLDGLAGREIVDGAQEFAELVPMELTAHLFGVPAEMGPRFRAWVDVILKEGQSDLALARRVSGEIQAFFAAQLVDRRERPREDLITRVSLAEAEHDDGTRVPFTERERIGALFVIMLGGVDTTWSTIGSSLFHLATHPDDLAALVSDRSLVPSAVEEFLRFYAPATVARVVRHDDEVGGCPVGGGERILMSFPSANRDPAYFDRPDEVVLDRPNNRHLAFGTGVHRCIGSNLARMELEVALRCWLARIPRFELAVDPSEIEWTTGPIRGPRSVPLRVLP